MKIALLTLWSAVAFSSVACAQGEFLFANWRAPTHLGSLAGPLAGTNIWAQMTAGPAEDGLAPVGAPHRHGRDGTVHDGIVVVPTVPPYGLAFIQMVVWDGNLWGDSLAAVPPDQLGRTDVVGEYLVPSWQPHAAPWFTQSAIVPIPEPGAGALAGLGWALLALGRRRNGEARPT